MNLLFFRGTDLISAAIRFQTRSHYSHVAIEQSNWPGAIVESYPGKGVRRRFVLEDEMKKYDVHRYELCAPLAISQECDMIDFLNDQIGKPYDYLGVLRFITRSKDPAVGFSKWFCSELAAEAFKHIGRPLLNVEESWKISPALLAMSPLLTRVV